MNVKEDHHCQDCQPHADQDNRPHHSRLAVNLQPQLADHIDDQESDPDMDEGFDARDTPTVIPARLSISTESNGTILGSLE